MNAVFFKEFFFKWIMLETEQRIYLKDLNSLVLKVNFNNLNLFSLINVARKLYNSDNLRERKK